MEVDSGIFQRLKSLWARKAGGRREEEEGEEEERVENEGREVRETGGGDGEELDSSSPSGLGSVGKPELLGRGARRKSRS